MDSSVQVALEDAFPDRTVTDTEEAVDSGRPGNHVLRVQFANGDHVYLKLRVDGDADGNRREVATTRYARAHCAIRVPEVVATNSAFNPPYFATAAIDGTPASTDWASAERWDVVAQDIGRAVAGIATARFDDHGWITGGSRDHLDLETGAWSAVLADEVERTATEDPYPERFTDLPDPEYVADLICRRGDILDGAEPTLLYPDMRPENVFRNGRPGIIDWEWVLVGDPGLGLCWGEEWVVEGPAVPANDRDRLRIAVQEGYCEQADELPEDFNRRRPLYRVVTFLQKVKTFDLWAPHAPGTTADLAEWVRDGLNKRIAAAKAVQ